MIAEPGREPTAEELLHGLPQPIANPGTEEGGLEQVGKFAQGIRRPRVGWRRSVGRIGLILVALMAVALLLVGVLGGL